MNILLEKLKEYIMKQKETNIGEQYESTELDTAYSNGQNNAYDDVLFMISYLEKMQSEDQNELAI